MGSVAVGRENSGSIDLYYEDHGSGRPVVLIHDGRSAAHPGEAGRGAVACGTGRHVRSRGFGQSSKPTGWGTTTTPLPTICTSS